MFEAIELNPRIAFLCLSRNNLAASEAVDLAKLLERNASLVRVDVSHNNFGGAGVAAIANALKRNRVVAELKL